MHRHYFFISVILFLACTADALAQTAGPPADYKLQPDDTSISPDGTTTIEQYFKISKDGDYTWQFWARHKDKFTLLGPEQPDYAADFRFTTNSQWVVRMQKTGAGFASLYLYHLGPKGFVTVTSEPLSDMAWNYYNSQPDGKKLGMPENHVEAGLVMGTNDNYHSVLGENWPDSRYLVVYLAGKLPNHGTLLGWHCRYDLQKGTFDIPSDFKANNAKAVDPEPK